MSNRILIDPQAFARQKESLSGTVVLADLHERVHSPDILDLSAAVSYTLHGGTDELQRPFLQLHLHGVLPLQCQRCMKAVDFAVDENVRIVLFADEAALDRAMLADDALEGMVSDKETDVYTLLEDQILMALPLSPKHDDCPSDTDAYRPQRTNPFAVLAGLQKTD